MEWQTDSRLTRRMVLALALALLGYAALLGPVVWLLPPAGALVVCGVLLAILGGLVLEADRLAYLATRAVAIERDDHPELFDTVERLARQADLPRPPVAVIPSDEPNAMSAGTGNRTVVCVTLGLLKELDDEQLEAVLAHELAHVKNGDSSVLTVAGFPATVALAMLSTALEGMNGWAIVLGYFGAAVALAILSLPLLLVSLPGTLVLSRYREYAADRGAVAITGKPVALAEALAELHGLSKPPQEDMRSMAGFNAFCIVPSPSLGLPGTHPPTHMRIRKLRELAAELERPA
ncbi:heat shock protein HtpX [Halosimplex carlsbadense 2-9-1]|uniref:Heat shock protein HtpX n=1 Tax=Halosimplex carlsbadense 2-9-1 TaxID=797114 RepID=M0D148_9EURY|nr:M48 family metalloprotease [Halosimplex carlsbadense]ELZ29236.1 heat shock protein HtpX [Halosimplex carlsbadense 2-9-1]